MDIQREEFWEWATSENPLLVEEAKSGSQFHKDVLDYMFMGWLAKAQKQAIPDGFVLVEKSKIESLFDFAYEAKQYTADSFAEIKYVEKELQAMIEEGEIK